MPLSGDLSGGHLLMGPEGSGVRPAGRAAGPQLSPAIHRQLAGYDYRLVELPQRRWSHSSGRAVPRAECDHPL